MTVYPDLVFLIGLSVYGGVCHLALRFVGLNRWGWQIAAGVLILGGTAVLSVLPAVSPSVPLIAGIVAVLLMFRGKNIKGTLLNAGCFLLILGLYLGILFLCSFLIFRARILILPQGSYWILSFFECFAGCGASYIILGFLLRKIRKYEGCPAVVRCTVVWRRQSVSADCFADSGNLLRDPVSRLPVVIVERRRFSESFGKTFPCPGSYAFSEMFGDAFRVVPYRSVDGIGRMLYAFVPDDFFVEHRSCRAVVAVVDTPLECRGRFSGIIGSDLLKGENTDDFVNGC